VPLTTNVPIRATETAGLTMEVNLHANTITIPFPTRVAVL